MESEHPKSDKPDEAQGLRDLEAVSETRKYFERQKKIKEGDPVAIAEEQEEKRRIHEQIWGAKKAGEARAEEAKAPEKIAEAKKELDTAYGTKVPETPVPKKTDWSHVSELINKGKTPEQIAEERERAEESTAMPTPESRKKATEKISEYEKQARESTEKMRKQLLEQEAEKATERREEFKRKHGHYPGEK